MPRLRSIAFRIAVVFPLWAAASEKMKVAFFSFELSNTSPQATTV
jgi:hypothetical protein